MVQLGSGVKALQTAFRFAFCVYAKQICRIIPHKVGRNTGRTLDCRRQTNILARTEHFLFACIHFMQQRNNLGEFTVFSQLERITDFRSAPAGRINFTAGIEGIIILRQRLQNHLTTSAL